MNYKKLFVILTAILIVSIFYFRDYIPTTRSDAENLYYFITNSVIPTEAERSGGIPFKKDFTNQNESTASDSSSLEGSLDSGSPTATSARDDNTNTGQYDGNGKDSSTAQQESAVLPESVNNFVPFISQAPFANWDKLHEEACEEASLAMAHYFMEKRELVLSKEADKDIVALTNRINKNDITIAEVKKVAEDYYKYSDWKIIDNPGTEEIKKILASGKIIIAPMAGRELGNPNFKQPGPLYHMLVISGYNNKKGVFITQDPGTRKGKNYEYKFKVLIDALHDFPGDKNKINEGDKIILIVS